MILAFLRAEIHSKRVFRELARKGLNSDLSLVGDKAHVTDARQNQLRRAALAYRGVHNASALFNGFPADTIWKRVSLSREDFGSLIYAKAPEWVLLSRGTRRLTDGAAHVGPDSVPQTDEFAAIAAAVGWPKEVVDNQTEIDKTREASEGIAAVVRELEGGRTYPEIILAAERPDAQHIVIEGHTRATAYFLHMPEGGEIEAFVGYSPGLPGWHFF